MASSDVQELSEKWFAGAARRVVCRDPVVLLLENGLLQPYFIKQFFKPNQRLPSPMAQGGRPSMRPGQGSRRVVVLM